MKVVIAPDSFKGCLPAEAVAEALSEGVVEAFAGARVAVFPVADGGEGTSRIMGHAVGAERMETMVSDPLRRKVKGVWYRIADTAYIDVAAATALTLLDAQERNPVEADSYGTGQLIKAALDAGCRKFFIGLGGSATIDGGVGMACALGLRFYDDRHCGCETAVRVAHADFSGVDYRLGECEVMLMSDVTNPLTGMNGAARVFGPQKGVSSQYMTNMLDNALARVADAVEGDADEPGAGAAGGIGFMLKTLVARAGGKACFRSGATCVLDALGFDEAVCDADIVITGEGRSDAQTLMGKIPYVVMCRAKNYGVKTISLSGEVLDRDELLGAGFYDVASIHPHGIGKAEAMTPEVTLRHLRDAVYSLKERLAAMPE